MELEDGAYVILAADTKLAVDVADQIDARGTNVQLYDRNGSNAQFAWVVTNSDKTRSIFFPLTGKVLDYLGGVCASGTNVGTWDATGAPSNKWTIEDAGTTAKVDGMTLGRWFVHPAADATLFLDPERDGAPKKGSNLWLYTKADYQEFVFYPLKQPCLTGTYELQSALDHDLVVDVGDASKADGANCIVYTRTGNPNQAWKMEPNGDGSVTLYAAHSGKCMDVCNYRRAPAKGDNVIQWSHNGGSNQRWFLDWAGWDLGDYDEADVYAPAYVLRSQFGESELVLDACGARTTPGTNVWLWDLTGSKWGRAWRLVPTEPLAPLGVPSKVMGRAGQSGADGTRLSMTGDGLVYPTWTGPAGDYEVRYRLRTRSVGASSRSRSSWGPWRSLADGSAANDGWGAAWRRNCVAKSVGGGRVVADHGAAVTWSSGKVDLVDVQFEVRRFDERWGAAGVPAHGPSASATVEVDVDFSVTVGACAWSPEGLMVPLTSDLGRGENTVRVSARLGSTNGAVVFRDVTESHQDAACTVEVPNSKVLRVPPDGSRLWVWWRWETSSGLVRDGSATVACGWGTGHGETISPSVTDESGMRLMVSLGSHEETGLWVRVGDGDAVPVDLAEGVGHVAYPFGVPFELFAFSRDSDVKWDTWHKSYEARRGSCYCLTWGASCLSIDAGHDAPPTDSVRVETDVNAKLTTGRTFEVATAGPGRSEVHEISGVVESDDAKDLVDALLAAAFATLRDPWGLVCRVVVTEASVTRQYRGFAEVSVTARRLS